MDYYNLKQKNIYAGGNNGRGQQVIYGDGFSDILGGISKGVVNLISKKSLETAGNKILEEGGKALQNKAVDLSKKTGEKLAEKAFSTIEDKVLGKANKEIEEAKPRTKATRGEILASRKRIRDIMNAERARLLASQKIRNNNTTTTDDKKFYRNLRGEGLVQIGKKK